MSIRNLDRMLAKIELLGGNSKKSLKKGIHRAAIHVQGDAKMLAPVACVAGGRLRDSIQADVTETFKQVIGKVSTNVEYAPYVEFGTGKRGEESPSPPKSPKDIRYRQDWAGMTAQPFLYPALVQNEDKIKTMIVKQLKQDIKKLGGDG